MPYNPAINSVYMRLSHAALIVWLSQIAMICHRVIDGVSYTLMISVLIIANVMS